MAWCFVEHRDNFTFYLCVYMCLYSFFVCSLIVITATSTFVFMAWFSSTVIHANIFIIFAID